MEKFNIKEILGHSDIAPLRKIDPGVHFPWEQVYKNLGIIWIKDRCDNEKMNERDYINFLKKLREFGYPNLKLVLMIKIINLLLMFHRKYLPKYLYKKLSKTSLNKINDLLG